MQAVRITETFYETDAGGNAVPRFEAGKYYPVTDASQRQVALGNGELVEVPDDAVKAQAAADAAAVAADKATAKAGATQEAADAAASLSATPA